jgi:nicotinamidase-related amidase
MLPSTHLAAIQAAPCPLDRDRVGSIWRVDYQSIAGQAAVWAQDHSIAPAAQDQRRVALLAIDVQNTFCSPGFELFVGGRSGSAAIDDTARLCEFIYRNLGQITEIIPTMDTHQSRQIFHPIFWVNPAGEHPIPAATTIGPADLDQGTWRVNPDLTSDPVAYADLTAHARHYVATLSDNGKYPLTIWPYHAMLGGIGHALVSAFEEACFFHSIARRCATRIEQKGDNPLTENYSILRPEVLDGAKGQPIAHRNQALIDHLLTFDAIVIAGQAKSHCVAWTVADLLTEIEARDPSLANKVYLLDDCTSPVVVPGIVDFSEQADEAYDRFAKAGMNVISSLEF